MEAPVIALLVLTTESWACSCGGGGFAYLAPAPDAIDVPRNAMVRIGGTNVLPGALEVYEDGVLRDDVVRTDRWFAHHSVVDLAVDTPYAPGATVEVRAAGSDDTVVTTFRIGEELDETPPEWGGAYEVESLDVERDSCGRIRSHTFHWDDLADDHWDTVAVMSVLDPVDPRFAPARSWGDSGYVEMSMCRPDDPTLERHFHRQYEVTFEDLSGNRSEPFVVSTRGGCGGCGVAGPPTSGWIALAAIGALASRRRRR